MCFCPLSWLGEKVHLNSLGKSIKYFSASKSPELRTMGMVCSQPAQTSPILGQVPPKIGWLPIFHPKDVQMATWNAKKLEETSRPLPVFKILVLYTLTDEENSCDLFKRGINHHLLFPKGRATGMGPQKHYANVHEAQGHTLPTSDLNMISYRRIIALIKAPICNYWVDIINPSFTSNHK